MNIRVAGLAAAAAMVMVAAGSGVAANASGGEPAAPVVAAAAVSARAVDSPQSGGTVGAVTGAGVTAATTRSLTLQWTNPSGGGFSGVVIRRAKGARPPGFTTGTLVAMTGKTVTSFTNKGLAPGTRYSYALFARGTAGRHAPGDAVTAATNTALTIATGTLPHGTAGMTYQATLAAAGGTPPYRWRAAGLPRGLTVAASGVIKGYPAVVGATKVTVTVTDAEHTSRTATLTLAVPAALPAGCAARACAQLTPDGQTVHVPAADIRDVTRNPASNAVTKVGLSGITVTSGDVLVLAPRAGIPSGLIALARTVTPNTDGTVTVAVTAATPADAYDTGTVQALPASPATGTDTLPQQQAPSAGGTTAAGHAQAATLECSGKVTSGLHGMSVAHALTPSLAAIWKHPYFGGGGVYAGSGGLRLFQFDLDGTITLNMGITVSGAATCTLTLPELTAEVPAGYLGAVIFTTQPKLSFTVTGKIDIRSTVTLSCGAEYRWDSGTQSRVAYCLPSKPPLQLSADSGLDATLAGTLDVTGTLDDIAGITGDIWADLHAGYHPATHPVAELDASAGWDLGACLLCFWSDSPAHVTIGSGTFFTKTIATYDNPPAPTPPVILTTALPAATVGKSYTAQLTTADHRPGTWKVTTGGLPAGLALSGYTITGTPTGPGTFTDAHHQTATAAATLTVLPAGPRKWTAANAPVPANAASVPEALVSGVSCPSPSFCAALGEYDDTSGYAQAMVLTWTGGTWSTAQAPLPADTAGLPNRVWVGGVSCPSASFCTAVGSYADTSGQWDGLLLTWSGGAWTAARSPVPGDASSVSPYASVIGVSCPSASFCTAVGSYENTSGNQLGMVLKWSGGAWTAAQAPLPANAVTGGSTVTIASVDGVSCPSASFCTAVGWYNDTSGNQDPLLLTRSNGTWTAAQAPLPADATKPYATVDGVSCPSTAFCTAAGWYNDTSGYTVGMLLTWSGGTWTAAQAPLPAGFASATTVSSVSGVSCPSTSYCIAGGGFTPNGGTLLTWSGGAWTTAQTPVPATSLNSYVSRVSCPSATFCAAAGDWVDNSDHQNGLLLTSSG
jgi:Fibronectin type III domain